MSTMVYSIKEAPKMLTFNPYFRLSAKELLQHKFFDGIRKVSDIEQVLPHLEVKIAGDESLEYQTGSSDLSVDQL